jgi:hypothetical protein
MISMIGCGNLIPGIGTLIPRKYFLHKNCNNLCEKSYNYCAMQENGHILQKVFQNRQ